MVTTLYGASDDCIELEGDLYEEFYATYGSDEGDDVVFSNGTILNIVYGDGGVWRITLKDGSATIVKAPEEDESNYSDRATVEGAEWAVCKGQKVTAK